MAKPPAPSQVDFFIHIPKTGGTTLRKIIEQQYGAGSLLWMNGLSQAEALVQVRGFGPKLRAVTGHLTADIAKCFPNGCRTTAFLRDPEARLISAVKHIRRDATHHMHAALKDGTLPLPELARVQGRMQAIYLAGRHQQDPIENDALVAEAKAALASLTVFGLMERFDESLVLIAGQLGWRLRGYLRANVAPPTAHGSDLEPETREILRAGCAPDRALYACARELFAQKIAHAPFGTGLRLLVLKAKCAAARWRHAARSAFTTSTSK